MPGLTPNASDAEALTFAKKSSGRSRTYRARITLSKLRIVIGTPGLSSSNKISWRVEPKSASNPPRNSTIILTMILFMFMIMFMKWTNAQEIQIDFSGSAAVVSARPSPSAASSREHTIPAPSAASIRENTIPAPSAAPAPEPFFPVSPETAFFACGIPGELDVSIIRKSPTYICIEFVSPRTFSSGSTSQSVRALFEPISDLLTSVTVKGSYATFNASLESTLIVAGSYLSSSAISSLTGAIPGGAKFYINPERGFIFNLYTIIITVISGKVTLVTLEEGCNLCQNSHDCSSNAPDSSAYQKSCHLSVTDCIDDENGGNACDLRVFIVWQGDDRYHSSFTSAGLRPSRFAMFPVAGQQILDQMKHI